MTILKAEGPVRRRFKEAKCETMWEQKNKGSGHREEDQAWSHIKDVKEED